MKRLHAGAAVGGIRKQLAHSENRIPPAWLEGLTQVQIAAIAEHRSSRPTEQLPATLQRDLGRAWQQQAGKWSARQATTYKGSTT